jgi:hypothetical protein
VDVEIDNSKPWRRKHWKAIKTSYGKAQYFETYSSFFKSVYEREWTSLAELDICLTKYLASQLALSPEFLQASTLDLSGKRTCLLLEICKMVKADRYISSIGAKEYMENDGAKQLFQKEDIGVEFLKYSQTSYPQLFGKFVPELSIVDCLFNCGSKSPQIVINEKSATIQKLV